MRVEVKIMTDDDIYEELLSNPLLKCVCGQTLKVETDFSDILKDSAITIVNEIKEVLKTNYTSDYVKIEKIMKILHKNNIECGNPHHE